MAFSRLSKRLRVRRRKRLRMKLNAKRKSFQRVLQRLLRRLNCCRNSDMDVVQDCHADPMTLQNQQQQNVVLTKSSPLMKNINDDSLMFSSMDASVTSTSTEGTEASNDDEEESPMTRPETPVPVPTTPTPLFLVPPSPQRLPRKSIVGMSENPPPMPHPPPLPSGFHPPSPTAYARLPHVSISFAYQNPLHAPGPGAVVEVDDEEEDGEQEQEQDLRPSQQFSRRLAQQVFVTKKQQQQKVRFHPSVSITEIPSFIHYTQDVRHALWMTDDEQSRNSRRNRLECSFDGGSVNWRNALEEDNFVSCGKRLLHPATFQYLQQQQQSSRVIQHHQRLPEPAVGVMV